MGVLTVYLDKVTHLKGPTRRALSEASSCQKDPPKDEDTFGGDSDPYVRFELEQDNLIFDKDYGEKKSSKKKDESSPEYGESFEFEVPDDKFPKNFELSIKIMDDDLVGDDKIGKCKIKLEDLDLGPEPQPIDECVDRNIFSKSARIYLHLSYTPSE